MSKPFSVNTNRFDPYKSYRFLVYFATSTTPVAGVSKVGGLKRTADVIEYKEGGNAIILKGFGRMKYDPITLEPEITRDTDFHDWADSAQVLDKGAPSTSLKNLPQTSASSCSTRPASRSTDSSCIAAGSRSIRPCPTSTRAGIPWRSSTSRSRTKAGKRI